MSQQPISREELVSEMKSRPKSTEEILRERMIFRYHNGTKWCCADPIEIQIHLQEKDIDWDRFLEAQKELDQTGEADSKIIRDLVAVVREIFNIDPIGCDDAGNPTGKTSLEVMDVMLDFLLFLDELKKTEESNPTLQRLTELESSTSSNQTPTIMDEESSPTEPSANSGSTKNEPSIDEQRQRSSA